jgi:hypothetical protein
MYTDAWQISRLDGRLSDTSIAKINHLQTLALWDGIKSTVKAYEQILNCITDIKTQACTS